MHRSRTIFAVVAFGLVAGVITLRTVRDLNVPGMAYPEHNGLIDFRDMLYYPGVSLLDGRNPYDAPQFGANYPVERTGIPYPPGWILVHLPFALLPQRQAEALHYGVNLALSLLLAYLTLQLCRAYSTTGRAFAVATVILMSRPGQMTLFAGQGTFYIVAGTYLALLFSRSRPWLAGIGIGIASIKPTFALPLALLLLACGDFRSLIIGSAISAALLGIGTAVLVKPAGGLGLLIESFSGSYAQFRLDPGAGEVLSVNRIDAAALIGRLMGNSLDTAGQLAVAAAIIALGALGVARLTRVGNEDAREASSILICMTILTCAYHQAYDALILAFPAAALVWNHCDTLWRRPSSLARWTLLGLIAVPGVNYLASHTAGAFLHLEGPWWIALTSINGAAVLAAFLLTVGLALQRSAELSAAQLRLTPAGRRPYRQASEGIERAR